MLPIFLDHILHPTLTQAGFVTEVYHVNGKGEEGGVVFAEMQGKEHTIERSLQRELNREINPPGSAYRSVTGGLINEIRKLNIGRIREFHAKYYKPWNICLHVDGDVPVGELLRVLNNVIEPMILDNMPSGVLPFPLLDWTRPFVETASALGPVIEEDKKRIIRFAGDDESSGEAIMAWKGPRSGNYLEKLVSRRPWISLALR
jgi:Zn-dependent M16 (insulinase) family peptidase